MSNVEVKRPSVLTRRFLIVLVIVAVACAVASPIFCIYTPRWANESHAISRNIPAALMLLAILVGNLMPRVATSKHIALISAAASTAVYMDMSLWIFDNIYSARTAPSPYNECIDWIWGPELQYIQQLLRGRLADVPWMVWMPSLAWWMIYTFLWFLFNISFITIVRRRWIDIELLPYPASYLWSIPIIAAAPERRAKGLRPGRRFVMFLGGLLLGFFYMWPPVLRFLVPWFPDIYGWSSPPYISWWFGAIDATLVPGIGDRIVALLAIPTNIVEYTSSMLLPLDILLTAWITGIILIVAYQVAYLRGYYSGILNVTIIYRRRDMLGSMPPFKIYAVYWGMGVSIIIFWLILNWRYMIDTIRAAIKGPTREEWENEALPYRVSWGLFLVSAMVLMFWLYAAGLPLAGAVLAILTYFLGNMSGARIYGLSFSIGPVDWMYLPSLTMYLFPNVTTTEQVTPEYANTIFTCGWPTGWLNYNAPSFAMWYRVAKDVGVKPRDMFWALFIAFLAASLLSYPVALKVYYKVGMASSVRGILEPDANWLIDPATWQTWPAMKPWWPNALIGAVIIGVLSYLRVRFIWWPFDPVGVYVGLHNNETIPMVWFVAWLIKYLVIKFGGMRAHDGILVPLVAGISAGTALCWFIGGIAALPKYLAA
ncbi:MAG: hypothetical protein DRZ82_03570 [Thermoprotei archaeon]|nr:MAG: hypothetical protein DRZ82_03570 [Thermoprotei archaeon]